MRQECLLQVVVVPEPKVAESEPPVAQREDRFPTLRITRGWESKAVGGRGKKKKKNLRGSRSQKEEEVGRYPTVVLRVETKGAWEDEDLHPQKLVGTVVVGGPPSSFVGTVEVLHLAAVCQALTEAIVHLVERQRMVIRVLVPRRGCFEDLVCELERRD